MKPVHYARVAGALFAAETVFAVVHLAMRVRYTGYTYWFSVVLDVWLVAIWGASALAGWVHRSWPGFFMMLVGAATSLMHGLLFTIATSDRGPVGAGIPLLVAGSIQLYCWAHAGPAFFEEREEREEPKQAVEAPEKAEAGRRAPWAWVPMLRRHAH